MNEKERIEELIKSVEMLDDAIKFHSLLQRLHKAFLKVLTRFIEESEKKGGDKSEENLQ